jgi:glycine dehydrogenase subunit 1
VSSLVSELLSCGFHAGLALGRWYPEMSDSLLLAVTEKRTRSEIDGLVAEMKRVRACEPRPRVPEVLWA